MNLIPISRAAAVGSSLLLIGTYVCFRAGMFQRTPAQAISARPTLIVEKKEIASPSRPQAESDSKAMTSGWLVPRYQKLDQLFWNPDAQKEYMRRQLYMSGSKSSPIDFTPPDGSKESSVVPVGWEELQKSLGTLFGPVEPDIDFRPGDGFSHQKIPAPKVSPPSLTESERQELHKRWMLPGSKVFLVLDEREAAELKAYLGSYQYQSESFETSDLQTRLKRCLDPSMRNPFQGPFPASATPSGDTK